MLQSSNQFPSLSWVWVWSEEEAPSPNFPKGTVRTGTFPDFFSNTYIVFPPPISQIWIFYFSQIKICHLVEHPSVYVSIIATAVSPPIAHMGKTSFSFGLGRFCTSLPAWKCLFYQSRILTTLLSTYFTLDSIVLLIRDLSPPFVFGWYDSKTQSRVHSCSLVWARYFE